MLTTTSLLRDAGQGSSRCRLRPNGRMRRRHDRRLRETGASEKSFRMACRPASLAGCRPVFGSCHPAAVSNHARARVGDRFETRARRERLVILPSPDIACKVRDHCVQVESANTRAALLREGRERQSTLACWAWRALRPQGPISAATQSSGHQVARVATHAHVFTTQDGGRARSGSSKLIPLAAGIAPNAI